MTAAERFVKRMLGGISSSQYLGNGSGGGIPEQEDLAKHDKHYHPDGYNPQTDECSLRDGMETKLEEGVDADIVEPTRGWVGEKTDGSESLKGARESLLSVLSQRKDVAPEGTTVTESGEWDRGSELKRVGENYAGWSGGEEVPPWVEQLSDEDLKEYSGLLDSVMNNGGDSEAVHKFESQKNDEYVSNGQNGTEQAKEKTVPIESLSDAELEKRIEQIPIKKYDETKKAKQILKDGFDSLNDRFDWGVRFERIYKSPSDSKSIENAKKILERLKGEKDCPSSVIEFMKAVSEGVFAEQERRRNQQSETQSAEGEEPPPEKPRSIAEVLSDALNHVAGQQKQAEFERREQEKQAKREAVARYLESGDEIEIEVAGKKSTEELEGYWAEKIAGYDEKKKEYDELVARTDTIRGNVKRKDFNALMREIGKASPPIDFVDKEAGIYEFDKWDTLDKMLYRMLRPKELYMIHSSYEQKKVKSILKKLEDNGVKIPETAHEMLKSIANGDFIRRDELKHEIAEVDSYRAEIAKAKEKEESKKRELRRMVQKELEYQREMTQKGLSTEEKSAEELGIPDWMNSLLNHWGDPKQRARKDRIASEYRDGQAVSVNLGDAKRNGFMIFGNCPRWFDALAKMKGYLYRPKDAYRYSMYGDRTHTMRFQGFADSITMQKGKTTLRLTPHCMVTDGWHDTTDSENKFVKALRDNRIETTLGMHGEIEVSTDEEGRPKQATAMRYRDLTPMADRLTSEEVQEIVDGKREMPEDLSLFIDSVYRGGDSEYPKAARGMITDDLIPITDEFSAFKINRFAEATRGVMKKFPAYSRVMGEICAGVGEFEDGYVNGEVKCAKYKDGRQIAPFLIFSGARKPTFNRTIPSHELIESSKKEAEEANKKFRWRPPSVISNCAPSKESYMESVLIHELGHVYFEKKGNRDSFEQALLSTERKIANGERRKVTTESKLSEAQFPWLMYVSDYAATNMNELHSECLAMCAMPHYEKGTLPQAIEDYCFAVLNGNFESAEK